VAKGPPCPACANSGRKGKVKEQKRDRRTGLMKIVWRTCGYCNGNGHVKTR
jgi:DnaJ-class molecular chaperone